MFHSPSPPPPPPPPRPPPGAEAQPLPAPPGLPRRYSLHKRLGEGSVGTVYAAFDAERNEAVAIKLLSLGGWGRGEPALQRARFAAEAAAAQRLAHPDIVATLDAGSAGPLGWLVMELVPGVPLSRYAQPARLLPEALVLRAVQRLAAALAHAHAAGVVHRDIKPANVLVHWPQGVLKLADFGLARQADSEATRTGIVMGSPAYMAPELLAGAAPDMATDCYALGVTLFELLCGQLPFMAPAAPGQALPSIGELLRRVAHDPVPALALLRPDLPAHTAAALDALLQQLLAKRAAGRVASASRIDSALQAAIQDLGTTPGHGPRAGHGPA